MKPWRYIFVIIGVFASALAPRMVAAESKPPEIVDGHLKLGFDRLAAFKFVAPPYDPTADTKAKKPDANEQIPAEVKAWHGKKALVTGYMMPVKLKNGLVIEFMLVKDPQMCCYGQVPNPNEWIIVSMPKGVRPLMDIPLSFYGELKIGANYDNGFLTGIYRLEGERMAPIQD